MQRLTAEEIKAALLAMPERQRATIIAAATQPVRQVDSAETMSGAIVREAARQRSSIQRLMG